MSAVWDRFRNDHEAVLDAQTYAVKNAAQTMAADSAFRTFLAGRMEQGEPE